MSSLHELRMISLNETNKNKKPKYEDQRKSALILGFAIIAAPFIAAASLLITPLFLIYAGFANKMTSDSETVYECGDAEFDEFINQINEVSDSLIKMQSSSKYSKLVYNHAKNEGFGSIEKNKYVKHDPRNLFRQGKRVYPCRSVMYYSSDSVELYKELLESRPNKDVEWWKDDENDRYIRDAEEDIANDMYSHLKKLGFGSDSKSPHISEKYPMVEVYVNSNGNGSWVYVRPNTNRRDIIKRKEEQHSKLSELRKISQR